MLTDHEVIVVGSGFAGIGMAVALRRAGIEDFVVLERADTLGGTWRDNHYPGCGCDVPTPLYSFSFAPNPHWSHFYAKAGRDPRLHRGHRRALRRITPHLRFGADVTGGSWDEAAPAAGRSRSTASRRYTARFVIGGFGGLNQPVFPDIPGLEDFAGPVFHSAAWDHSAAARGPARRRDRYRRQRDPARSPGGEGGRPGDRLPAHAAVGGPEARPADLGPRAAALRSAPAAAEGDPRGRVHRNRGRRRRHHPRPGADADRRGVEQAPHAQGDRRPRAAGEADAELSPRVQADPALQRLVPDARAGERRARHRRDRADRARAGSSPATASSTRSTCSSAPPVSGSSRCSSG